MTHGFQNASSGKIVSAIAAEIVANKAYLSEIDGKIGDGDHGVNMAKGFGKAADQITEQTSFHDALMILSNVLMGEIGGSMGPLYGMMFMEMAGIISKSSLIDGKQFEAMLRAGVNGITEIGGAKIGDKTLIDCAVPAMEAFSNTFASDGDFAKSLLAMRKAAETGRDSTVDMVAKIGRSARLGERSRGVLDAGATSCCMILTTMGTEISLRLNTAG